MNKTISEASEKHLRQRGKTNHKVFQINEGGGGGARPFGGN